VRKILTADPVEPSRRNPALASGLDHIVMRCLSKKPEDRYPSSDALAASLYPLGRRTPARSRVLRRESFLVVAPSSVARRLGFRFGNFAGGGSVPAGRAVVSISA